MAVHDAVTEARRAGLRGEARMLVEAPPPPAAPTDAVLLEKPTVAAVNDEAGRDLDVKATVLGKALQSAIAPCAPILKVFGAMANEEPARKVALFP